jgi:signal peptidase I
VVALEGETIEMCNCEVQVDGELLDETYLDPVEIGPENLCGGDFGPVVVADGHVLVMGDNRDGPQDSRAIGPVDLSDVFGVVDAFRSPGNDWQPLNE